jgi:cytochrome c oxidase cbb3-type subunit 3
VAKRFAAASLEEAEADPALRDYAIAGGHAALGAELRPLPRQGRRQRRARLPEPARQGLAVGRHARGHPAHPQRRHPLARREDTRNSQMPAFGAQRILERARCWTWWSTCAPCRARSTTRRRPERAASAFAEQCAACHGESGEGNQGVGAPRLSDDVWLYGGSRKAIYETLWNSRAGVMPAFGARLSEDTIRKLVVYVRAFGGGE